MIKTLAMPITPDTYPIAVACLPPSFVLLKKKDVMGSYLVINDLRYPSADPTAKFLGPEDNFCDDSDEESPRYSRVRPRSSFAKLSLNNFWVPRKLFKKEWEVVGDLRNTADFFAVVRK